ncbi:hypothetical protein EON64_13415 [archaeon]|nr:MAG: hypothetical protein EON64_13415 [archaeon]
MGFRFTGMKLMNCVSSSSLLNSVEFAFSHSSFSGRFMAEKYVRCAYASSRSIAVNTRQSGGLEARPESVTSVDEGSPGGG